jgi:hypothetical protein
MYSDLPEAYWMVVRVSNETSSCASTTAERMRLYFTQQGRYDSVEAVYFVWTT